MSGSYFVVRLKSSIKFNRAKERPLHPTKRQHILVDKYIVLSESETNAKYPKRLRRVVVWDEVNKKAIELITNNSIWTASTIAELYKSRWHIEQFFKDIKQLLKIKSFLGTTENAVQIQIWTALIAILILKYFKAMARYG